MKRTKKTTNKKMLSLRHKLTLYFMLFCAIMLAFLWIFQTIFLETSYTNIKRSQVENCAGLITDSIKGKNDTVETINRISQSNEISVYVFDTSSTIFTHSYTSEYINPLGRQELEMSKIYSYYNSAMQNGGTYSSIENIQNKEVTYDFRANDHDKLKKAVAEKIAKNVVYAEIIQVEEDIECFVVVTAMISPVESVVSTLRFQLVIITLIFLVAAAILAFFVSKRISNPITTMNIKVKEIAKQNYNVEFTGNEYREIKELSDTLNLTIEELKKVESLRQELIANISHDLRTPLTMITGYAEVMRDLPDENTAENVQVIIDEANRLTNLVNDMLDLSKIKSGADELSLTHYNLTESIRDIFNRYTKLIHQENFDIQFFADKEAYVYADEIKIGQVIYNFINNAINHCGESKKVFVTQKVTMGKVRVEVIDFGEGIDPDKLEYIWDRYYKVDKNHQRGVIGTGLGLSIVKRILDMHSAKYGVKSKLGSGSVFWFELEVTDTSPVKAPELPPEDVTLVE